MLDLSELQQYLPISHLEPETIGFITGLTNTSAGRWKPSDVTLIEPPAGRTDPYVDPLLAMAALFRAQGEAPGDAAVRAEVEYAALRPGLPLIERVRCYDSCEPDTPECVPFPRLLEHLQARRLISEPLSAFLARALDALASVALFRNPERPDAPWTLSTLPDQPPPQAMIAFIPGPPWRCDLDKLEGTATFAEWHQHLRPIVERLEKALGESVYRFRDLDCAFDDDYGHRFLELYCCCRSCPEAPFVQFLLEATSAEDLDTLKAALIDPENYRHPFEMNYSSCDDFEARALHFRHLSPGEHRTVGLVFSSLPARAIAEQRLLELIDVDVWIVAPKALVPDEWLDSATRHCRDCIHRYLHESLDEPIDLLTRIDELCVISDHSPARKGADLGLRPSIEDLLWLAHILKVPTEFLYANGSGLSNPEVCLKERRVPERVAEQTRIREAFTRQLTEIRLENEESSSGLWDDSGHQISYDALAIPFDLLRRIAAWQAAFDDNNGWPASADEAWWERHDQESAEIAKALHQALGGATRICYRRNSEWQVVNAQDS